MSDHCDKSSSSAATPGACAHNTYMQDLLYFAATSRVRQDPRMGGDIEECVRVVSGLLVALDECRDALQPAVGDANTSLITTLPAMWIGMGVVTAAVAAAAARKKH